MKRQKVCALLCVAVMSATNIMPAMAADAALPEETVAVQNETDAAGEPEEVQEEEPAESTEETEETGENQEEEIQLEEEEKSADGLNNDGETFNQDSEIVDEEVLTETSAFAETGWQFTNGYWYYFQNGEILKDTFETINGNKYYFRYDGKMKTGCFQVNCQEGKEWVDKTFYANASGAVIETPGWQSQGGAWYYVKENGEAACGELVENINGNAYYFNSEGVMQTGRIWSYNDDEELDYVTNSSGAIVKGGWVKDGFDWYYTDTDGAICTDQWIGDFYVNSGGVMAVGETIIDGKIYIFDENGYKQAVIGEQNGWKLVDGTWYYAENGEPYNGWLNHTYYIKNGEMHTNAQVPAEYSEVDKNGYPVDGRYSYVGYDGVIVSGWIYTAKGWMYAEKNTDKGDSAIVKNGWRAIGGVWYYFRNGYMLSNVIKEIDEKLSLFATSGAWQGYVSETGWKQVQSGDWYYINEDGTVANSGRVINGETYYFNYDGVMLKNEAFFDTNIRKYIWVNCNGTRDYQNGWKQADYNKHLWYYAENGYLVEGAKVINGVEYYFSEDGSIFNDCIRYDNIQERFFLYDGDGRTIEVTSGWHATTFDGRTNWYYFRNGKPVDGYFGNYYLDNGRMLNWLYFNINTYSHYIYDEKGHLVTNGWVYRLGSWFYAGKTGRLYTGEWYIGGKKYIFNSYGEWVK